MRCAPVVAVAMSLAVANAWVKSRWDHAKAFQKIGHAELTCASTTQPAGCCLCWTIVHDIESQLNQTENDHHMEVVFRISEEKKQIPYSRSEGRILEVLDTVCDDVQVPSTGTPHRRLKYAVANACHHFVDEFADELTTAFYNNLSPQQDPVCVHKLRACALLPKDEL
ncbi:hypothetical protein SDRG_15936 [Saprolegnia diclina VS20]|uniref:Saposin B-type domain-containing protein n=1 Tax=Saprolegnia diclina (strain VS20) TaxID=1156394 RepID=T0PLD5_SAPDV|nr:hypothetical protein SDRG_15936 [Saprolegnia diclina VS20]EQC26199.1 hypothetical protein SDRG_15936 [Saprolegnia diclina VS20]|eukprot:XP_008620344.1 hypothetical protein SDRG_15936 [Saprolegnia diclina VS20]